MVVGVADINLILLVAGMATVISVLAGIAPVTDAVIVSVPEAQLLSAYVEVAVPVTMLLVTGVVRVALGTERLAQGEVNATDIGTVAGEPPMSTGTDTLLVP